MVIALNSNLAPGDMADEALMKIAILISALYKFYFIMAQFYITNFAKYKWFGDPLSVKWSLFIHKTYTLHRYKFKGQNQMLLKAPSIPL